MYLQDMMNNNKKLGSSKLAKESYTFSVAYDFWAEALFERTVRLFVWKGTGDVDGHEIETTLMLNGSCGVTNKYKKKLAAFYGQYAGKPTVYYDIFEDYSIHSPLYSAVLKVDEDIALIWNNSCRNSVFPIVHRYAIMLAHLEVSLLNTLINGRTGGAIPVASTQSAVQSIQNFRNSLCNGKVIPIQDPAFLTVDFKTVDTSNNLNVKELMETRQNLLNSFYNDIGVKTAHEKKGNMIEEEVSANDSMLLLNLNDMLAMRQKGAEAVNKLYGTNWSVDLAEELKYMEEDDTDDSIQSEGTVQSEHDE